MKRTYLIITALVLAIPGANVMAQGTFGNRNVGGGISGSTGRNAGLTQTGQVQSEAAMQRTQQAFVGSSSQTSGGEIRSLSGTTGGGGGLGGSLGGGLGGLGGMAGMGGLGMGGLGGLGGLGMGGLGMGGMGYGGLGRGGLNGMNTFGMNGQFGNQMGMNGVNGRNRQIRTSIRIGPSSNMPVMGARVQSFQNRLARIPSITDPDLVAVRMDGSTAVLNGVVATPRDRELIARLVLLEPGVRDVRNELEVDPSRVR